MPAAYVTLAQIHDATDRHDLARQEFQKTLQLDPLNVPAMIGVSRSYERSGHINEAEATLQRAVDLRSNDWNTFNNFGMFYHRQEKYSQATAEYEKALQLTPDNAQVLANMAANYIDSGDTRFFPNAEKSLRQSISIAPAYSSYANLGALYMQEARYRESAAASEQALTLNDKNYDVWNNLLICDDWLKLTDKSEQVRRHLIVLLEQAIQLDPNDANAHATLATVYAAEHNDEKSLAHIHTVLALTPEDPDALLSVADSYELMGVRSESLQYIGKALKAGLKKRQLEIDPEIQSALHDPSFASAMKK
jgi:eukaryotic-like serine/threonine-protein kinase